MAVFSATLVGVQPLPVEIEIDISSGLPFFQIVGLPDAVLRESKTRVKSAIIQAGFEFPYDQRLVLNLAPSEVRKEGSSFELGLAARILSESGQILLPEDNTLFLGELALDGTVRGVPEMGALAFAAEKMGFLVIPKSSLGQITRPPCPIVAIERLQDLLEHDWWDEFLVPSGQADGRARRHVIEINSTSASRTSSKEPHGDFDAEFELSRRDFLSLRFSHFWAKHLEIAALGAHHYLICGPPGCGKTFFAESLRALLELLPQKTSRDVEILNALFRRPASRKPWSAPHHSATIAGLVGGGAPPRPGAVTKAHGGILFLDELLEFPASVLDCLREPLEKGVVEIHRAGMQTNFPSRFQLIAATNPCRCGYWGHPLKNCLCGKSNRERYQSKMSGPFFDRFDVRLKAQPLLGNEKTVRGEVILKKILGAFEFKSVMGGGGEWVPGWDKGAIQYLFEEHGQSMVSRRFHNKTQRVAETLACLEGAALVETFHVREALAIQTLKMIEGA